MQIGIRSTQGDERFRALFEHAPVGVALCEPDGSFCDVNATFRDILGGTAIDLEAGNLLDLLRYTPVEADEVSIWRDGLEDLRDGTAPIARAQLSLAPSDAHPRFVQVTAAPVTLGERSYLLVHLEDATGRRLEERRLVYLATHDALTRLPNRELVQQRLVAALDRAATNGIPIGVLYIDLDGFKALNDRHGHHAGDAVLAALGRRLPAVLRAGDSAGRLSGDEFLVVAGDVSGEGALAELVRRIEGAVHAPVEVAVPGEAEPSTVVEPSASIGAVLSRPGEQPGPLIRRADAAMYATKRARRREHRRGVAGMATKAVDLTGQRQLAYEQSAVAEQC